MSPCPSLSSDELVAADDPAPFVAAALLPASVVPAVDAAVAAAPAPHEPELEIPVVAPAAAVAAAAVVVVVVAAAAVAVVPSAPFPER